MPEPDYDPVLTPPEAAKFINLTPRFLTMRRYAGGGPPHIRISRTRVMCSIEIEMSGLVEIEMSSFGVCSFEVERTNGTGGGDADIEPARSSTSGSAAAGAGRARGGAAWGGSWWD